MPRDPEVVQAERAPRCRGCKGPWGQCFYPSYPSIHPSIRHSSIHPRFHTSIHSPIHLSLHPSVYPCTTRPFVHLSNQLICHTPIHPSTTLANHAAMLYLTSKSVKTICPCAHSLISQINRPRVHPPTHPRIPPNNNEGSSIARLYPSAHHGTVGVVRLALGRWDARRCTWPPCGKRFGILVVLLVLVPGTATAATVLLVVL